MNKLLLLKDPLVLLMIFFAVFLGFIFISAAFHLFGFSWGDKKIIDDHHKLVKYCIMYDSTQLTIVRYEPKCFPVYDEVHTSNIYHTYMFDLNKTK